MNRVSITFNYLSVVRFLFLAVSAYIVTLFVG